MHNQNKANHDQSMKWADIILDLQKTILFVKNQTDFFNSVHLWGKVQMAGMKSYTKWRSVGFERNIMYTKRGILSAIQCARRRITQLVLFTFAVTNKSDRTII